MMDKWIGKGGILHNGLCQEVLKEYPDNHFDMIITSPPYDNLRTYGDHSEWNFNIFKDISKELVRTLKEGAVIVWIVSDATINGSETGSSFEQALFFKNELGMNINDTMIWLKPSFSSIGSRYVRYPNVFEYMFIFSKGKVKTFNPIIDRKNKGAGEKRTKKKSRNKDGSMRIENREMIIAEYGQRFNVWENAAVSQRGADTHPAPFPVNLIEDHIISWSNNGDLILDPFIGSGTTAIAAINQERKWIGIENNPEYFKMARDRIGSHTTSMKLEFE